MFPKLFRRNVLRGITPWQFSVRVALAAFVAVLAPAFLLVAVAPLALALLPIAILVLPFLIPAFFGEANHHVGGLPTSHLTRAQPKPHG
jgi:hypothetical protein